MSVTASIKRTAKVPGSERRSITEVTMDNSYAENGEALSAAELGLRTVDFAYCNVKNGSESEAVAVGSCWYDATNAKLRVNDYKTQKEMAAGKDLSKVVIRVYAFGK
jgi:hypothetical protein